MKAIVVTSQRSGSNFLRHCMNTHPKVTFDGELLIGGQIIPPKILEDRRMPAKIYKYVRARAWRPDRILDSFLSRRDNQVVAFKAMYNHLSNSRAISFILQHPQIRIIHLRRENLLKQYVSKMLLGKKREHRWQPHATSNVPVVTTRISPEAAIAEMRKIQDKYQEFEGLLAGHQKIELVYETMIEGACLSGQTTSLICNLLDIDVRPMCCEFVKINPNKLELMVENYQELVRGLSGTEFEQFLD